MKFHADVNFEEGRTVVTMSGMIDERSEWPELNEPVKGDLILDLKRIVLLNSIGVRNWIHWLHDLKVEKRVVLINCSPPVVKQINILEGFLNDQTKIESIFAPYYCEDCAYEENKLINIAHMKPPVTVDDVVDVYNCPKCGMKMELDMLKSQYFAFLGKQKSKFKS